jgi:hypothetical protein
MELRTIVRFSTKRLRAAESSKKSCVLSLPNNAGYGRFEDFGKRAQNGADDG